MGCLIFSHTKGGGTQKVSTPLKGSTKSLTLSRGGGVEAKKFPICDFLMF